MLKTAKTIVDRKHNYQKCCQISRRALLGAAALCVFFGEATSTLGAPKSAVTEDIVWSYIRDRGLPENIIKALKIDLGKGASLFLGHNNLLLEKLFSQSLAMGYQNSRRRRIFFDKIDQIIQEDYRFGRTKNINGWILADSECQMYFKYLL